MLFSKVYPVTCHTDHVGSDSTFVAIKGFEKSGEKFIEKALRLGATKVITDKDVHDSRKALATLSAAALDFPANKLKIIGITGTKGKTTTVYLIEHILKEFGCRTARLTGVENKILDDSEPAMLTSPSADYLQMFFAQCVKKDVECVVMEVSSHALSLHRVHGVPFIAVGFTNLSSEHMDYHQSMDEYFKTKCTLFDQIVESGYVVCNTYDEWGRKAFDSLKMHGKKPIGYDMQDKFDVSVLFGEYNAHNISMATTICRQLGMQDSDIIRALKTFPGVPGRLQKHVLKNGAQAFVDFAHNPSSMEAVLKTLRLLSNNLIVVFGCGGDRDKTKRSKMGRIADKYADVVIITNDNPRGEDPAKIIEQICSGIKSDRLEKILCIPDRGMAIANAVKLSTSDSILAILGKGHESYQIISGEKLYFNDFEEISRY